MRLIPLTRNHFAMVDDSDFEMLMQFKWRLHPGRNGTNYAVRSNSIRGGKIGTRNIFMHRQILNICKCYQVDHINSDGLDNRKENLRSCLHAENQMNRRTFRGSSKYKGVCWDKSRKNWMASIQKDRKHNNLGRFENEILAAEAYDYAALLNFGEFAHLNFPVAKPKYLFILERVIADNLNKGLLTLERQ